MSHLFVPTCICAKQTLALAQISPTPTQDPLTPTRDPLTPTRDPLTPTSAPTPDLCGDVGSCTINPDPHYNIWCPNTYYDFQGGWYVVEVVAFQFATCLMAHFPILMFCQ